MRTTPFVRRRDQVDEGLPAHHEASHGNNLVGAATIRPEHLIASSDPTARISAAQLSQRDGGRARSLTSSKTPGLAQPCWLLINEVEEATPLS